MAAGEFLLAKKTFAPDSLAGLDLGVAVKQIQPGAYFMAAINTWSAQGKVTKAVATALIHLATGSFVAYCFQAQDIERRYPCV